MVPVKRDLASDPTASTTGVARSMPTSAVSSAEKTDGLGALDAPLGDLAIVHEQRTHATRWIIGRMQLKSSYPERNFP
jgi:hypothetical protein